jgi:MFS family permease
MPRVRRRSTLRLEATPETAGAAAERVLAVAARPDGTLAGPLFAEGDAGSTLSVENIPDGDGTIVTLAATSDLRVPFFSWFVGLLLWFAARRPLRSAAARLRAEVAGVAVPPPAPRSRLMPPVAFTAEQAGRVAALAAVGALANFGGSLLTQSGDAVVDSFDRSSEALGFALALIRVGVLVSLVAAALADRWGRRRMMLLCLGGICIANAVTAAAPSFEIFTGAQLVTRSLVNAVLVVAGFAAVEEAPEGARAFTLSLFGLSIGLGFGLSVVLLPLADLSPDSWRIAFVVSAATILLLPALARSLRETRRYAQLESRTRTGKRGRLFEVFDRRYGARFLFLGLAAFLNNVFSAPSSQLMNRYLTKEHDFSNAGVAVLRSVTAGVPGFAGLLIGGRLAETRGRRPVAIVGLAIAAVFQMGFFVSDGPLLWLTPTIAIIATAGAGLALGTLSGELFPTETRGTSNGFLLVCGVSGSVVGLLLATQLEDVVGGLGPAIALCGLAPLVAAFFVVPRLPETRARKLDEISPSEI